MGENSFNLTSFANRSDLVESLQQFQRYHSLTAMPIIVDLDVIGEAEEVVSGSKFPVEPKLV